MKKRFVVALSTLAAGAIAATGALPASGAVKYTATPVPAIGHLPAVDTSTNTIYSLVDESVTSGSDTDDDTYLTAVDGKTDKTRSRLLLSSIEEGEPVGVGFPDLRVDTKTHTVWISETATYGPGWILEVNGSTMKLTRTIEGDGGYSQPGEIAVNPSTDTLYAAWDWDAVAADDNSFSGTPVAPYLSGINGSSGAVSRVTLATPTYDDPYGEPGNVAFDSANSGVYVSYDRHEYAYSSSRLRLASSVAYPASEERTNPTLTADGSTHTIYALGESSSYKIAGATNTIAATAAVGSSGGQYPVVDPSIKTLYLGTQVLSDTTLARTGTLPEYAASVNGSTHAIYSIGYVTTRSGS